MSPKDRTGIILLLMAFGAVSLGGCASTQETSTLQQSVSVLYDRVQALEKRLDGVDTQGKKSADTYSRMEEMRMKMGALNGRMDELDHKLQQLARPQSTVQPPVSPQVPEGDVAPSEGAPPASGEGTPGVSVSLPPEPVSPEKALYDKASGLYQQGKYDLARKEFQTLASRHPKSDLADNALFSAGECHFAEKKYQDAIEVYQQVLDRYPKGDRIPHALLKQGTAFQQMGDPTAARILYERLVEKYPDSPQAQIAKKKLKQMP